MCSREATVNCEHFIFQAYELIVPCNSSSIRMRPVLRVFMNLSLPFNTLPMAFLSSCPVSYFRFVNNVNTVITLTMGRQRLG